MRMLILATLASLMTSSCGFLDEEIWLDDGDGEYGVSGLGLSGYGSSGCSGTFMHRTSRHGGRFDARNLAAAGEILELDEELILAESQSHRSLGPRQTTTVVDPTIQVFVDVENELDNVMAAVPYDQDRPDHDDPIDSPNP